MATEFSRVLAFYPSYCADGLVSVAVYPEGEVPCQASINTLLKQACRHYAIDRRALANAAHFVTGKRNLVPLPLSVHRTFVPLKIHSARVAGDCAYGYFLLQAITTIEGAEGGCRVHLMNGLSIAISHSRRTAVAHLARATLFEKVYWSKRLGSGGESGIFLGNA